MCTYTSVSSGSGSGGGGGGSGGYGVDSIYSNKRTRKQKVPKRGPGVAELEKILREQEKKKTIGLDHHKTNTNDHHEGFSLEVPQFPSLISYPAQSPPPPPPPVLPSLPKKVPFAPDPDSFSPPRNINTSSDGSFSRSGGNGSGGSNTLVLPEITFNSPTTWNSYEPNKFIDIGGSRFASAGIPYSLRSSNGPSQIFPSPTLAQIRSQFPTTSMISDFPQLPIASSSCSTLTSSSAGMCHVIEPPSNQTSYHPHHYTSVLPEEDKMVCRKRSCPFSMDIPPTPFHYQVPTFSTQGRRQDSSFPPGSHSSVNNLEPIDEVVSRDLKVDCKCNIVDYGEANSHFLLFGSPTFPCPASTHVSHRDQRSKFNHSPSFQENKEESLHRAGTGNGSIRSKPFFSFLVPLEQMSKVETTYSLNNNRVETRGDGIDLDLRL